MPAHLAPAKHKKSPRLGAGPIGSKYRAQRIIGRGAFGTAFLVTTEEGEEAVLKRVEIAHMDEQQRAAAEQECAVLEHLADHPFVIKMHTHFVEVGRLWILMDFADGGDLARQIAAQLDAGRSFDEEQALDWFVQICLALRYAHERKVLHRDVKPQNIFLMRSGSVRLGDFGISRTLTSTMSLAFTTVGTPLYLAPEVCQGEAYDASGDAWSAGVLLHELCALRPPFRAPNMPALVMAICRNAPPPLPAGFERAAPLLARLLDKDPKCRASIGEVLQDAGLAARVARMETRGAEETTAHERRSAALRPGTRGGGGGAARPGTRGGGGAGGDGTTRTSQLRAGMHKRAARSEAEAAAARGEAGEKREALREQIRQDRLARRKPARAHGEATPAHGKAKPSHGEVLRAASAKISKISLFELVLPEHAHAATADAATPPLAPPEAAAAEATAPAAAAAATGGGAAAEDGCGEAAAAAEEEEEEALRGVLRRAVAEAFPGARLLSEAQRAAAAAGLQRRAAELRARAEAEGAAAAGEAARLLQNDAQRELLAISRMLADVQKRYVLARPSAAAGAAVGGAAGGGAAAGGSGRLRGLLPSDLNLNLGLIEQDDIDEDGEDDADGPPPTPWAIVRRASREAHAGGGSRACTVS